MKNAYAFSCIVALVCGGLTIGGCSSSDSGGTSPGVTDTGSGGTDTGGGGTDTGGGGTDTSVTDTGGGGTDTAGGGDTGSGGGDTGSETSTCGSDPTLHPPVAGEGPYCPGLATDGGASGPCPSGQVCCESKKGATPPSSCAATAAACPPAPATEATWECDAASMCATGMVCCGNGTPTIRTGCTYYDIFPAKGTVCAASCTATQYTVCEADADCTGGKVCTPMKTGGKQIGFCK